MQNPKESKFWTKPVAVGVANENVPSVGDVDPVGEVGDALAPENRIHSTDDQEIYDELKVLHPEIKFPLLPNPPHKDPFLSEDDHIVTLEWQ